MSYKLRKLGYYILTLKDTNKSDNGDDSDIDLIIKDPAERFITIINYIISLPLLNRFKKLDEHKFYYLNSIESVPDKLYTYKITFIKAKHNHRPKLINSLTATERENPKTLEEAEEEITHLALKILPASEEICVIMEERMSGISANQIANYLNHFIKQYRTVNTDSKFKFSVNHCVLMKDDYIDIIKTQLKNVKMAEVYYSKEGVGSEMFNFSELGTQDFSDDVVMTLKAQPKGNILDGILRFLIELKTNTSSKIKKVKLTGFDHLGKEITLINDKNRKLKTTEVNLSEATGQVLSNHMFDILIEEIEDFM